MNVWCRELDLYLNIYISSMKLPKQYIKTKICLVLIFWMRSLYCLDVKCYFLIVEFFLQPIASQTQSAKREKIWFKVRKLKTFSISVLSRVCFALAVLGPRMFTILKSRVDKKIITYLLYLLVFQKRSRISRVVLNNQLVELYSLHDSTPFYLDL